MKKLGLLIVVVCFALAAIGLNSTPVAASSVGLSGFSGINPGSDCSVCHTGGDGTTVPQIAVIGASQVEPSATVSFMLAITSTSPLSQTVAGWNVLVADAAENSAGAISGFDAVASRLEFGELTHVAPQMNDANGAVTVAFDWTAPSEPGTYTIYYAGNSANNDGFNGDGDAGAAGSFEVNVAPTLAVGLSGTSAEIGPYTLPVLILSALALTTLLVAKRRI